MMQIAPSENLQWNQLKGSWNLSLQTLGWGRYLAERDGQVQFCGLPRTHNPMLQRGYTLLASPTSSPEVWGYDRECENPDEGIGTHIWRSGASD